MSTSRVLSSRGKRSVWGLPDWLQTLCWNQKTHKKHLHHSSQRKKKKKHRHEIPPAWNFTFLTSRGSKYSPPLSLCVHRKPRQRQPPQTRWWGTRGRAPWSTRWRNICWPLSLLSCLSDPLLETEKKGHLDVPISWFCLWLLLLITFTQRSGRTSMPFILVFVAVILLCDFWPIHEFWCLY